MAAPHSWTPEQDDIIRAGRTGDVRLSYAEIAAKLGRRSSTCQARAYKLKIEASHRSRADWTEEQDQIIREGRRGPKPVPYSVLAEEFGYTAAQVAGRAMRLGCPVRDMTALPPLEEAPKNPGLRRCLGHCGKQFHSPDRSRVRLCDGCKGGHANGLPAGWL